MQPDPLVLVVDDEAGVRRLLEVELAAQGFRVLAASGGEEALRLAEEHRPDAVILDIMMPGFPGLEVMRRLRQRSNVPILLVTAKDAPQDRVRGLELGADDYVVKPFHAEELAARLRAVLRRAGPPATAPIVRCGTLEIDLERRLVSRAGEPIGLTRTEWLLLQHLAANPDRVITAAELLVHVWGPEYRDELQYLRVWVSRLRAKIEETPSAPRILRTLPGIGYMLVTGDSAPS